MKKLGINSSWGVGVCIAWCTILLIEALLWAGSLVSKDFRALISQPSYIIFPLQDERLGHRPNPNHPEHDSWGFKNKKRYDSADIVALGDSQTYAIYLKAEQAWPKVLERATGKSVYNMSYNAYGATHATLLAEKAAVLQPKRVIFMLYMGNDLLEAYRHVNALPVFPTLAQEADVQFGSKPRLQEVQSPIDLSPTRFPNESLGYYIKTLGLFEKLRYVLYSSSRQIDPNAAAANKRSGLVPFSHGTFKTVFTPAYRQQTLDMSTMEVQSGLYITVNVLAELSKRFKLLVVILPTKETAFSDMVFRVQQEVNPSYQQMVQAEAKTTKQLITQLKQKGIETLYLLDAVSVREDKAQTYFRSFDGHINAAGQEAVGRILAEHSFVVSEN